MESGSHPQHRWTHDPFMVCLVLATGLHVAILFGVTFGISLKPLPRLAETLDVVLVQWRSEDEPDQADYLAQACRSLSLTLRLEKIILGGGLMLAPHLLERVRDAYDTQMADYLVDRPLTGADIIHRPGLGDDAGLHGAIWLARSIRAPRR